MSDTEESNFETPQEAVARRTRLQRGPDTDQPPPLQQQGRQASNPDLPEPRTLLEEDSDNSQGTTILREQLEMANSLLDPAFADVLLRLINIENDISNEIVESLVYEGIKTWKDFKAIPPDFISDLTKRASRDQRVPLMRWKRRQLLIIRSMVTNNFRTGVESWTDQSIYTLPDFEIPSQQFNDAAGTTPPPPPPGTGSNIMSAEEKEYNSWTRTKRSKDDFDILIDDSKYFRWFSTFQAELAVQGLENIIDSDPKYDRTQYNNHFSTRLYDKKIQYFWTVLLKVFQNPLGKSCISDNMSSSDSRAAFLKHDKLQNDSPALVFATTEHFTNLNSLSLSTFSDSRVKFISEWFEHLRILNDDAKIPSDRLGFDFTRGILLNAVSTDADLPLTIKNTPSTGSRDVDIENLKHNLLQDAALADGKDSLLKKGKTRQA